MAFEFDASTAKAENTFDPSTAQPEKPSGALRDLGKSLKVGVQKLPGMVTGLADLPIALATGARPFTSAADAVGEATGFQPGKWADETQRSDDYKAGQANVNKAWAGVDAVQKDESASKLDYAKKLLADAPEIAGEYLKNPMYTANQVVESVPGMIAGGAASKLAKGLGALAGKGISAEAAAAGAMGPVRNALPGYVERVVGDKWVNPVVAGMGEGAVAAGSAMDSSKGEDQQKNAIAALGAGVGTGLIGIGAGRFANKLGLETSGTAMAKLGDGTLGNGLGATKRILGGAISEAAFQELPQSMQEAMWQNYADGKPIMQGVARQGIEGALAGAVMGGGANVFNSDKQATPPPEQPPAAVPPLQLGNTPDPYLSFPDGTVARQSEIDAYINGLPVDQQPAARAKVMGLAPQPVVPERPPVTEPKALGYNPLAGTPTIHPDGTVTLNGEQEFQRRTQSQPATPADPIAEAAAQGGAISRAVLANRESIQDYQDQQTSEAATAQAAQLQQEIDRQGVEADAPKPIAGDIETNSLGYPLTNKIMAGHTAKKLSDSTGQIHEPIELSPKKWVARRKDANVSDTSGIQPVPATSGGQDGNQPTASVESGRPDRQPEGDNPRGAVADSLGQSGEYTGQVPDGAVDRFDVTHAGTAALADPKNASVVSSYNQTQFAKNPDGSTRRVGRDHFESWANSGGVSSDVGSQYDGHGIAKGNPLGALLNILTNGINTSRRFDSAPLTPASSAAGAGSGLGSANGAYKDGPFILLGERGKSILDGIKTVLVSDEVAASIPALQQRFPDVRFVSHSNAQAVLSQDANVKNNQAPANGGNAETVALANTAMRKASQPVTDVQGKDVAGPAAPFAVNGQGRQSLSGAARSSSGKTLQGRQSSSGDARSSSGKTLVGSGKSQAGPLGNYATETANEQNAAPGTEAAPAAPQAAPTQAVDSPAASTGDVPGARSAPVESVGVSLGERAIREQASVATSGYDTEKKLRFADFAESLAGQSKEAIQKAIVNSEFGTGLAVNELDGVSKSIAESASLVAGQARKNAAPKAESTPAQKLENQIKFQKLRLEQASDAIRSATDTDRFGLPVENGPKKQSAIKRHADAQQKLSELERELSEIGKQDASAANRAKLKAKNTPTVKESSTVQPVSQPPKEPNGTQADKAQPQQTQQQEAPAAGVSEPAAVATGAGKAEGVDNKAKWIKAVADKNRLNGSTGVQLTVTSNGKLSFLGDPNSSKDGRALQANLNEALKAGATVAEIAEALKSKAPTKPSLPESTATEHAGVKIYPITLKGESRWAVQSENNRSTGLNKSDNVLGDTIHSTLDEAKQEAERQVARVKSQQERSAAHDAEAAAAQAKKDANKGKSIVERKRDADLDKPTRLHPNAGLGTGTRRESMQKAVDQDRYIEAATVRDEAAKKRDTDLVERSHRANLPTGNINYPGVKEYFEAQARLKANKYEKPEYRVYMGRDGSDSFYEITKTEYDYAQELKAAYPAIEGVERAEPWKMTRAEAAESFPGDEYDKMLNRSAVLGDITYEEAGKRSRINVTGNKEFWAKTRKDLLQDKKDAVKFARGDRAEVNKMKPTEGFAAWRIKSMSATGKAAIEAAGKYHDELLAVHKERVQEALDEGKDVPPEVLADYPDLAKPDDGVKPEAVTPVEQANAIEPLATEAVEDTPDADIDNDQIEKIGDFGRKVMVRKDEAQPTGRKMAKSTDERPAWSRPYVVMQATEGRNAGKWRVMKLLKGEKSGAVMTTGSAVFDTEQEALNMIPMVEVARNHRAYPLKMDASTGYGIYRLLAEGKKRALVKGGFASSDEAMAYMAKNPIEIIEHKFKFPERPWLDKIERTGVPRRTKNVTKAMFEQTFAPGGVVYGNWLLNDDKVTVNSDGQELSNLAFDALMDLAETLGVPPKALFLNGEMVLALGADGKGGINSGAAHYSPDKGLINLTKINGAGSLAHEWWHSVDHYFAKSSGWKDSNSVVSYGFNANRAAARPELMAAIKKVIDAINYTDKSTTTDAAMVRENAQARIDKSVKSLNYKLDQLRMYLVKPWKAGKKPATAEQLAKFDAMADKLREGNQGEMVYIEPSAQALLRNKYAIGYQIGSNIRDMNAIYKSVVGSSFLKSDPQSEGRQLVWPVEAIKDNKEKLATKDDVTVEHKGRTDFYIEAREIDGFRSSSYWSTPHEMGARAFESYIFDKLTEGKQQSDYLVYAVENRFYAGLDMKPYPEGSERQAINKAFDELFKTIETKETENGNVAMYSQSATTESTARTTYDTPSTVQEVQKAIRQLIGITGRNKLGGTVATTAAEIKSTWEPLTGQNVNIESEGDAGRAQAYFDPKTNTVFLIADHIRAGTEMAVAAHELMHKHGQAVLGKAGWDKLHDVIGTWKNADKESDERLIYDSAAAKVRAVGERLSNQELFPYAVEAAMKAGIKPNAMARQGSVQKWLAGVIQSMKEVWGKITGKPDTFKVQDLVDLAFAIAQRENPANASISLDAGQNGAATPAKTKTPEFRKWFGDSKVVDADGKPLVVYHGTPDASFTEFKEGSHFTADPDYAAVYTNTSASSINAQAKRADAPATMPVYLSIQKPFDTRIPSVRRVFEKEFFGKWGNGTPLSDRGLPDWTDARDILEWIDETDQPFDGILVDEGGTPDGGHRGLAWAPVKNTQIKSATGNRGTFDATNPDIRYSMGEALTTAINQRKTTMAGQTARKYTPDQLAAMKNVGFQVEQPSLKERAQSLWKDAGKKLAQGIADQFAPVKDLDKQAYGLLRLAKGASGAFEAFLKGGKLKITDGVYDFDETNKGGVVDKLLMPLQGEHHDFMRWVAANRAERLTGEGKENLFSKDDIKAMKTLADGKTDFDYTIQTGPARGRVTRDRPAIYADANRVFNEFNKNVLDMAEQSGLIDGDSRKTWEHEFYVPFYRVADEETGGVRGMSVKGSALRQKAFHELKGGKNALNADLLDNTMMNWAHLLDASAKNRAAKATIEAAERMGVATGGNQSTLASMGSSINNKQGVVWFMDGGQKRYSLLDNKGDGPYVMAALSALEYAGMRNPVMLAMGAMKHALTVGVTASPFFKVKNLIRDSVSAIGTGNLSYNPAKNLSDGWKRTDPKSDEYFRLLAGGGTIHFGTMLEGSEAKRIQALVESGVDDSTILNSDQKVKAFYRKFIEPGIEAYNELGNRGEAVNRAALYDQLRKQGVNHADASLQARDLMDFSMQGTFTTIRFLTQVVPFFNARIQGMYKLGRAAKENPARMGAVLGATTLFSLALLAAYGDDDDWKKREEWDRNNFWWFKFGDTAFRIPKPFEIGAIGTLAERSAELAFDNEMTAKRYGKQIMTLLGDNLSMNPVPQLVKPILDVYANKDSFSGRPIETMSMERLQPEYRFNDRTSMTARAASTAANSVTNLVGVNAPSPVQIDSMLRGYFGWLGSFIIGSADKIARPLTDQPGQAAPDYFKTATGSMVSDLRDAPSRYVSSMYDQAKEIEQAYGTWRALVKEGKTEEAAEFAKSNKEDLDKYRQVERVKQVASSANQRIRMIERSAMDADTKRTLIREIQARKDKAARELNG